MLKVFMVYMVANRKHGALYLGMTGNPIGRIWLHREGVLAGFTKRYGIKKQVWYEFHENAISAITREKQLRDWHRSWKDRLIDEMNPDWRDLYPVLTGEREE